MIHSTANEHLQAPFHFPSALVRLLYDSICRSAISPGDIQRSSLPSHHPLSILSHSLVLHAAVHHNPHRLIPDSYTHHFLLSSFNSSKLGFASFPPHPKEPNLIIIDGADEFDVQVYGNFIAETFLATAFFQPSRTSHYLCDTRSTGFSDPDMPRPMRHTPQKPPSKSPNRNPIN